MRARGLVFDAPRVISCYTSTMPLPCHTAPMRRAAVHLSHPGAAAAYAFCLERILTGASRAKVSGALVALFILCGWARVLVWCPAGHFVLYWYCAASLSHGAYAACCRPLLSTPPSAAAAYDFCSARDFTGVSRDKVLPRAAAVYASAPLRHVSRRRERPVYFRCH